jgi:hypothetical protein
VNLRVTVKSKLWNITRATYVPGSPSGYGGGLESTSKARENRCLRTHEFKNVHNS